MDKTVTADVSVAVRAKYDAGLPAAAFREAVNEIYHAAESENYDRQHLDHWQELPPVWQRQLSEAKRLRPQAGWRVLDVGCGTGLSGDMLQRFVADRIARLHCIDPSAEMLAHCARRQKSWPFRSELQQATVESVDGPYDLVTFNSVLHHVPDTALLMAQVMRVLAPGGLILTVHDPVRNVEAELRATRRARPQALFEIADKAILRLSRMAGRSSGQPRPAGISRIAIERTNAELRRRGILAHDMEAADIWALTDIHVPSAWNPSAGFDQAQLSRAMSPAVLRSWVTYHFHGIDWGYLSPTQRLKERYWLRRNDPHGRLFSSLWQKA